ncbi:MAG: HlyD family efflux transporter periplasmic adaptor subunit [Saprospiraceae bacterium]|nr:HlyD family efflux transporter periplasmic adaptor subunit [Saprospiraceae bacterium]
MDRKLTSKEQSKGKYKKWTYPILAVMVLIIGIYGFRALLASKANSSDFFIASIEKGEVTHTVSAAGIVIPAFEREINAPVATEIKSVTLSTGATVTKGDLILELDQEYTRLEYEQLKDELDLRKNNIEKLKLQFDKDLRDLDYQDKIKALQVDELKAEVNDQKRLLNIGGGTAEELEQAELKLKVAGLEKKMLENELQYKRSVNVNEKKGLELEYTIQEKRLKELQRKLQETSVRSPQSGVITWINEDIGRTVTAGETLVRIADLGRYVIEATSSDRNSDKLSIGLPVNVRIGNKNLDGSISRILPAVQNNTVKFFVELDKNESEFLRPNMRAEVFIITDKKENVLRIKNGAAFRGANTQEVFFVEGNKAVKRKLKKGISNSDYVEILSNANLGDKIIISETNDYKHLDAFILLDK